MPAADPLPAWLDAVGLEREAADGGWAVRVPSTKRGPVVAVLRLGERTLTARAFICRAPDRRRDEVYARLLRKNLSLRGWRFAVDDHGDVYLAADAPLAALDGDALDGLLGALATAVDETYEGLVRTGFDVPEGTEFRPPPG
ncbi:MAG: YbjN domain-containing protein [Thermoleophilia bacterium]